MEKTFFVDKKGQSLGQLDSLLAVTLSKGMEITLAGDPAEFKVVDWSYHQGEGLTVKLSKVRRASADAVNLGSSAQRVV